MSGRRRTRRRRVEVESQLQYRGIGEQSDGGCPHTDHPLPCTDCFFGDGGAADV